MEKIKENKKIIIGVIAILIVVLVIIFTVNKVTTNSSKDPNKLASSSNEIGISSVSVEKSGTVDGTYQINDGGQGITFTATLGAVGDEINYIINIKNTSFSPAAIIDGVEITKNDGDTLKYTTDAKGKIINRGSTEKVEFKILYDSDTKVVSSNEITVKFKFRKYGLAYGSTTILPLSTTKQSAKAAGLYPDSTESGRYYYSGTNPNNAIVFNGEPYRILGFEKGGRIKIIKMVSIGTQYWNTGGTNVWANSSLKGYLEETWLPTQSSGTDYQYLTTNNEWYVGAVSNNTDFTKTYPEEKKTTVNSPVGLVSASEVLKARYTGSTFLNVGNSYYWWTISAYSAISYNAWRVDGGSLSLSYSVSASSYGVFPVLYLKSSVSLTGSGTSSDPYCVAGSNCPTNLNFSQRAS